MLFGDDGFLPLHFAILFMLFKMHNSKNNSKRENLCIILIITL